MPFRSNLNLKSVLLAATILLVFLNLIYVAINVIHKLKTQTPYYEPGYEFADFKDKINGQRTVGYMTNRDVSAEKNDQEFLLAQYMFAPTILDINNNAHTYLILDYTSPIFLAYGIKENKTKPIYNNKFNKVLAIRQP